MDPKTLPFPTIGDAETLQDLIIDLATAIYTKPERKNNTLTFFHGFPKYSNFTISYWTEATLPPTLNDLLNFYFSQPITEKDRIEFLNMYEVPFMGTGKRLKDLYTINPAVFTPVLDALIQSKRIQRIIVQPNTLYAITNAFKLRRKGLRENALEEFEVESSILRELLLKKYAQQELEIANLFIAAQAQESKFLASEESMKAKIAANATRRKRKSHRGGKRSTRKVSSLRRRR